MDRQHVSTLQAACVKAGHYTHTVHGKHTGMAHTATHDTNMLQQAWWEVSTTQLGLSSAGNWKQAPLRKPSLQLQCCYAHEALLQLTG